MQSRHNTEMLQKQWLSGWRCNNMCNIKDNNALSASGQFQNKTKKKKANTRV